MANIKRRHPSAFDLRRDIDDALDDFTSPRALRREVDRLFSEDLSPRSLWAEMDRLLDDFVSPMPLRMRIGSLFEPFGTGIVPLPNAASGRGAGLFVPDLELIERDSEYLLSVDLPGVKNDDVQVSVDDGNVLTVRGERREDQRGRDERGYEYTERSYGTFSRSIELPRNVDASRIDADYSDGVLRLRIPKTEHAQPRRISVRGREPVRAGADERRENRPQINSR